MANSEKNLLFDTNMAKIPLRWQAETLFYWIKAAKVQKKQSLLWSLWTHYRHATLQDWGKWVNERKDLILFYLFQQSYYVLIISVASLCSRPCGSISH